MVMDLVEDTPGGRSPHADGLGLRGVSFGYGGQQVISNLSFALPDGIVGLLGVNGAGKSTLLGILSTRLRAESGTVEWRGRPLDSPGVLRAYRQVLGFLPQQPSWPGTTSVSQLLQHFCWLREIPAAQRTERIESVLDRVDLAGRGASRLRELSGGQRRRALLATAIIHDPEVLLLDEPSVSLDPVQRASFKQLLVERQRPGCTTVLSTHLISDVLDVADHVVVLDEGRVLAVRSGVEFRKLVAGEAGSDAAFAGVLASLRGDRL